MVRTSEGYAKIRITCCHWRRHIAAALGVWCPKGLRQTGPGPRLPSRHWQPDRKVLTRPPALCVRFRRRLRSIVHAALTTSSWASSSVFKAAMSFGRSAGLSMRPVYARPLSFTRPTLVSKSAPVAANLLPQAASTAAPGSAYVSATKPVLACGQMKRSRASLSASLVQFGNPKIRLTEMFVTLRSRVRTIYAGR